jgi:molybdopterin synthase sulfur carrier subunit
MSATMRIIPSLRKFTGGQAEVQVSGATVAECIEDLEIQFPGIKHQIFEEDGKLRSCFDVYVNSPDSFSYERLAMPVKDGGELAIIPVFGGG